jgi:DNA-binding NarL/FixJ family response regulator
VFFAALANVLPGLHLAVFVPADWPGDELPQPAESADDRGARRRLSPRQLEVLRFLAAGASLPQIAEELSLSETTVKTHARDALRRLGAKNRAHAVALAISAGLLRAHR